MSCSQWMIKSICCKLYFNEIQILVYGISVSKRISDKHVDMIGITLTSHFAYICSVNWIIEEP